MTLFRTTSGPTRSSKPRNAMLRIGYQGAQPGRRLIIVLYYYEQMTMKQIGETLDLSESRVSQMHSAILTCLRSQLQMRKPEFVTEVS